MPRPAPKSPSWRATNCRKQSRFSSVVRRYQSSDRKSTRLNSSHANISYAVFCLKKKKKTKLDNLINSSIINEIDSKRVISKMHQIITVYKVFDTQAPILAVNGGTLHHLIFRMLF